jgi:hypothetical protein
MSVFLTTKPSLRDEISSMPEVSARILRVGKRLEGVGCISFSLSGQSTSTQPARRSDEDPRYSITWPPDAAWPKRSRRSCSAANRYIYIPKPAPTGQQDRVDRPRWHYSRESLQREAEQLLDLLMDGITWTSR